MLWPTVSRSVCLGVKPHLGPKTRFLLLSGSCGFFYVGRPFWQEDGRVIYNCCWTSPAQSFSSPSPAVLMTIFRCLRFETPPTWRARSPYLSARNRVAQLYPQALGSLLVASYDSQGYSGCIRTRLHAGVTIKVICARFRTKGCYPFVVGHFWFKPLLLSNNSYSPFNSLT
jgi:hypothetical protein